MMFGEASARARWTLVGAAIGSVLMIGLAVLLLRPDQPEPGTPRVAEYETFVR